MLRKPLEAAFPPSMTGNEAVIEEPQPNNGFNPVRPDYVAKYSERPAKRFFSFLAAPIRELLNPRNNQVKRIEQRAGLGNVYVINPSGLRRSIRFQLTNPMGEVKEINGTFTYIGEQYDSAAGEITFATSDTPKIRR